MLTRSVMTNIVSSIAYDYENDMFDDEAYDSLPTIERTLENEVETKPPEDKNNWVLYALCSLGMSVLLPWFFFLTCNDYWMYRFRDLQNNSSNQFHLFFESFVHSESNHTRLQAEFISYISIASTVPSTVFLFINILYLRRFSVEWRVVIAYAVILLCFIETTILVLFDSDTWQNEFFIITIITAVFISMATAMLQAALSGIIMRFPVSYITAFSSGQSFAGVFAAVAELLALLVDSSPTRGTFVYFIFADLTIAASFFGFFAIQQNDFYKYHAGLTNPSSSGSTQYQRIGSEVNIAPLPVSYCSVQKKILLPSINIFLIYIVTGMLYPPIAVLICSVNMGRQSPWNDKYFVPVITYLSYCVSDYTGRICAGIVQKPKGQLSTWLSVMRIIFIPLLLFCNAQPRHHLPVLMDSDWIYFLIIVTFAFSGGYISTLAFILLPEHVLVHEQEVATTMLAISYGISVSIGSLFSVPLINLL